MIAFNVLRRLTTVLALVLCFGAAADAADPAPAFSDGQKQAIEKMIHQYLLDHPEVILEAVQRHREKAEEAKKVHAKATLSGLRKELENDPTSPVAGNVNGKVTLVEFFDYRCGYCKRVHPTLVELMKEDKELRVVFKEFPILGPESMLASRAAMAVWRTQPQKYLAFHDALMGGRGARDEASLLAAAGKQGIDPAALKKAMADPEVEAALARNFHLAEALGINGTPAFVVGTELVPGAVDKETLKKLIAEARGS
ncbi:MAG: DsbA family protein [Rhodospirillaceae bacterium]